MSQFTATAAGLLGAAPAGTMLYPGIGESFKQGVERFSKVPGVKVAGRTELPAGTTGVKRRPSCSPRTPRRS